MMMTKTVGWSLLYSPENGVVCVRVCQDFLFSGRNTCAAGGGLNHRTVIYCKVSLHLESKLFITKGRIETQEKSLMTPDCQ